MGLQWAPDGFNGQTWAHARRDTDKRGDVPHSAQGIAGVSSTARDKQKMFIS